jgi:hypothetical protein
MPADVVEIHAVVDGKPSQAFVGRFAWTLHQLVQAGERGCTPIDQPAPRWSHYVYRLRRDGVAIETIDEKHGGAFSGHHARYVLRSKVEVMKVVRAGEGRHAA